MKASQWTITSNVALDGKCAPFFCVCTCMRRWQCAQYITWLFMDKR